MHDADRGGMSERQRTTDVLSDAGSFSDLLLPTEMVCALGEAGFIRPSPVQKASIPLGAVGTDLIVQAKSGTGKTVAFGVICLMRIKVDVGTPQVRILLTHSLWPTAPHLQPYG